GQVIDCTGTAGGNALPGTACNDNNPNTGNDTWNSNCQCIGQLAQEIDCAGVAGGTAVQDECGNCWSANIIVVPAPDSDGDGVIDCEDYCPDTYNTIQQDFDGDGVGDPCDNCPWVYNPDQENTTGSISGDACQQMPTGIDEVDSEHALVFMPNPTLGQVGVRCTIPGARSLRFHDATGRLAHLASIEHQMDLEFLLPGVYIVVALDAEGRPLAQTRLVRQ
ncbi:MAG: thrombospondin type 3 repeat-containing protein, partial [Flavobacteriales bacterium]